jgi:peptide/nickel transport system substrate-binding protein
MLAVTPAQKTPHEKQFLRLSLWAAGLLSITTGLWFATSTAAEIDPSIWPTSWLTRAQTASELQIKVFHEPPFLQQQVKNGELPPVMDRLPLDPMVLEPTTTNGTYGGTARIFESDWNMFNPVENPLTIDPTVAHIFPNTIKEWEISNEGRTITFKLRTGIKWSNGEPLDADDFIFFHRHQILNPELTPVPDPRWIGSKSEKIDDLTFRYHFNEPFPLLINLMAQLGDYYVTPSDYMRQFHPDFVNREALIKKIRQEGYISWMAYYNAIRLWTRNQPPLMPTLRPFQLIKRTATHKLYDRNAYYAKIDSLGQQLPYIDQISAEIIENQDVLAAKAATGQVDFAAFELKTQDFPLFKLGEKTAGIQVLVWNRLHGSDVIIEPNLNIKDKLLRAVFNDIRFRKALSVAINRDEMNSIIYFNKGVPRQPTVIPTSRFFEPEFASAYTQYDPTQAGTWLNEMNLIDRDEDGFRDYANGDKLTITLEFLDFETPKNITLELVTSYWREVGLDIRLKEVDPALQTSRATAGLMQMTVWHADRTTDILFPFQPMWYVPMHIGWEESHWNDWATYYLSQGLRGEKPPADIIQLQTWWHELARSTDPERVTELGKKILRSTAENLWTIGMIGLAPQPVIVSKRLKNVTLQGYWGWDNRWTMPYHPATWYLEK